MWTSLLVSLACAWSVSGECLPWDMDPPSKECDYLVDLNGEAVLLPHAKNCSRYWICEPSGEYCLSECPACKLPGTDTCPDGVLYFDYSIAYPAGPVCTWATIVDCDDGDRPDYTTHFPTHHPTTQKPPTHPTSRPTTSKPTTQPTTYPSTQNPDPTTHKPTTYPPTQASTQPPTHPPTNHPTSPGTTTPGDCPDCVCVPGDDGWYKPYPGNCHKYYECTKTSNGWEITIFDCGSWVFDPHQAACTWPELMPCE